MPEHERSGIATALLNVVRLLGYQVKIVRGNGMIDIEAVSVKDSTDRYLVRMTDGDSADDEYVAACQLAGLLDVDWKDF